jgi:hypothetical protein
MFVLNLIFFQISLTMSTLINIQENFQYCHLKSKDRPLDIESICVEHEMINLLLTQKINLINNNFNNITNEVVAIIAPAENTITGQGFECQKVLLKKNYHESWTMQRSITYDRPSIIQLTVAQCKEMISSKLCGANSMKCDHEGCFYLEEPGNEEYRWSFFSTPSPYTEYYNCKLIFKDIISHSKDDFIFNKNCKISDFACKTEDSLIIWEENVIKECPYINLLNVSVDLYQDIFLNQKEKLAFEFIKMGKICGQASFYTTAGLHILPLNQLSKINNFLLQYDNKIEIGALNKLKLSEEDFNLVISKKSDLDLNLRECRLFVDMLYIQQKIDNNFFLDNDLLQNKKVFYSNGKNIFLPTCVSIINITISTQYDFCYVNTPVSFVLDNLLINAFLTHQNIIIDWSPKIKCKNENFFYSFPNLNKTLVQNLNNFVLLDSVNVKLKSLNYFNFDASISLNHTGLIVRGILSQNKFEANNHGFKDSNLIFSQDHKGIFDEKYKNNFLKLNEFLHLTFLKQIILLVSLLFILLVVIVLFLLIYKCFCRNNNTLNYKPVNHNI